MKYLIVLYLLFLNYKICKSQDKNYKITYVQCTQFDTSKVILDSTSGYTSQLIGNGTGSVYQIGKMFVSNEVFPKKEDVPITKFNDINTMVGNQKPGKGSFLVPKLNADSIGDIIYWNKQTDSVYARQLMLKEYIIMSEKTPVVNWQITDDVKTIAGYKCLKANTYFRGRYYTAWFAPDIPISDGPWKFKGLPGLIMEVVDDKKQVKIYAKKIEYPSLEKMINVSFSEISGKWLTLDKYIRYMNDELQKKLVAIVAATESFQSSHNIKGKNDIIKTGYFGIEKKVD